MEVVSKATQWSIFCLNRKIFRANASSFASLRLCVNIFPNPLVTLFLNSLQGWLTRLLLNETLLWHQP